MKAMSVTFIESMRSVLKNRRVVWLLAVALVGTIASCEYTVSGNPDVNLLEAHVSPVAATVGVKGR